MGTAIESDFDLNVNRTNITSGGNSLGSSLSVAVGAFAVGFAGAILSIGVVESDGVEHILVDEASFNWSLNVLVKHIGNVVIAFSIAVLEAMALYRCRCRVTFPMRWFMHLIGCQGCTDRCCHG